MNLKLFKASIALALAAIALLPYAISAAVVIDLGPAAAVAAEPDVESVETRFEETAKFLALMPLTLSVTVRVTPDGVVTLEYPWYSALTVDRREKLTTELKVAADNTLRSLAVGTVRAAGGKKERFSAEEAAAVTAALNRVLEENLGAEAP